MKTTKFKNWDKIEYEIKLKKPHKSQEAHGLCDYPESEECNKILVDPHIKERWILETVIHEMIHAYQWDLSETKVTTMARSITRVIYDLGGIAHFDHKENDPDAIITNWRKYKKAYRQVKKRQAKKNPKKSK